MNQTATRSGIESVRESSLKLLDRIEGVEERLNVLWHELFPAPEPANSKSVAEPPPSNHHALLERINATISRLNTRLQDLTEHLVG